MTDSKERTDFIGIQNWAANCKKISRNEANELTLADIQALALLGGLQSRSILSADPAEHQRRSLFAFNTVTKPNVISQNSWFMLPLHFAIMRTIEKVPGVTIILQDETARQDIRVGRVRADSEKICRHYVNVNERKLLGVKQMTQSIPRLLFNVPPDAQILERRSADYHLIIPETYVLTKRRALSAPPGQNDLLDAIAKIVGSAPPNSLPFTKNEIIDLLLLLFAIGDDWYWDRLDRLSHDHRRSHAA